MTSERLDGRLQSSKLRADGAPVMQCLRKASQGFVQEFSDSLVTGEGSGLQKQARSALSSVNKD